MIIGFSGLDPQKRAIAYVDNVKHEELKGLLGGDENGHYHLTSKEHEDLSVLKPETEINHENLQGLQGGKQNEHYHLTAE